jgi:GntR family transcriptional regulator/MocR family aminotransferase
MRSAYLERRDALLLGLARHGGDLVQVHNSDAGLHVTVLLRTEAGDHEVAARLGRRGIATRALSNAYVGQSREPGLLLGFGCAPPQRLLDATRILGDVLRAPA